MLQAVVPYFGAAGNGPCDDKNFLGLVPWYHYLQLTMENGGCQVQNFTLLGAHSSLLLILLAIVDDLLRVAGLLAVIFLIISGIQYIMSRGEPAEMAKAQTGALNSLLGLALALIAVRFVAFIGNQLGGTSVDAPSSADHVDLSSLPTFGDAATSGSIVGTVLSIIFGIAGALAFLYLVIGGFQYITSQGDPQRVAKAKNAVLYALIGLALAIVAQSIVALVVNNV